MRTRGRWARGGAHALQLLAWLQQHDYQMALKRYELFQARRQRRIENGNDRDDEPEEVINAKEMLEEIAGGKFCEPGKEGSGRRHQFNDPEFPPNAQIVAGCAGESRPLKPEMMRFSEPRGVADVAREPSVRTVPLLRDHVLS